MEKYIVEFLGTFALLMSIVISRGSPLAIGGTLALAILLGGKVSGGHFNPAVSLGLFFNKKMNKSDLLPYLIAQVTGGVLAVMASKHVKKML